VIGVLLTALFGAGKGRAEMDSRSPAYQAAREVGTCLSAGCRMFVGTVTSIGPPLDGLHVEDGEAARRPLQLNVEKVLSGTGVTVGSVVQLEYPDTPPGGKAGFGPWSAWEGAEVKTGRRLLVAEWEKEASKPVWHGQPQDIALVLSDPTLIRRIRQVVNHHTRIEQGQEQIGRLLPAMRGPVFAGYLLSYLMDGLGLRDPNAAASYLAALMGDKRFPPSASHEMSLWLVANFYRLSDPTQKTVTEALVAAGVRSDAAVADDAVAALVRLGDMRMLHMKPYLESGQGQKLAEKYRLMRSRGMASGGHQEFETQLGMRPE
jgi:hypothetical protein